MLRPDDCTQLIHINPLPGLSASQRGRYSCKVMRLRYLNAAFIWSRIIRRMATYGPLSPYARLIVQAWTVFSALSGMRLLACLIVAPRQGYDEPGFPS